MQTITVEKDKLITVLKDNRRQHRDQFLQAQKIYRDRVIEELDRRLEQARTGGVINLGFHLPTPVDYTSEYDTAIQMVEWEVDDKIDLDQQDFERYVLNKWEWARNFHANTTAYLSD